MKHTFLDADFMLNNMGPKQIIYDTCVYVYILLLFDEVCACLSQYFFWFGN